MLDGFDRSFRTLLERRVRLELDGDKDKNAGLYRAILSVQSWDQYLQSKASINAYESVLDMILAVARQLNEED